MTTEVLLKEVDSALSELGIYTNPIETSDAIKIANSVTNSYILAKTLMEQDKDEQSILVRINGQIWPPFTREGEDKNLSSLKKIGIETNVIYNDINYRFQVCKFPDASKRFDQFNTDEQYKMIPAISREIKKYHELESFKGHYPITATMNNAFSRLNDEEKEFVKKIHYVMMDLATILENDHDNLVFSHNDLFSSSIYIEKSVEPTRITLVDWEYSGKNHRAFDLAFLSFKTHFTPLHDIKLIREYDGANVFNTEYSFHMTKPLI
ncbi:MAG: phosphotransferase, partial [Chlamydiota bacterium]